MNSDNSNEAFEKCWAHLPLRAAARRIAIHQVSLLLRRTPPVHRCLQRQRVTEGTAMAPWNGPNYSASVWVCHLTICRPTNCHFYTPGSQEPQG